MDTKHKYMLIIGGVILLVVVLILVMTMNREKYNGVPPTWKFTSMDNGPNERSEQKKCAGKKWNS